GYKTATNDAPGTPTAFTGCLDGVFAVVTAIAGGKNSLPVAKHRTVFVVPERSTLVNQADHVAPLHRQFGDRDGADSGTGSGPFGLHHRGAESCAQDSQRDRHDQLPTSPTLSQHEKNVFLEQRQTARAFKAAGLTLKFQETEFDAFGRKLQGDARNLGSQALVFPYI